MASSQRLASQKNREPRLAVRAVKGTLFSTGGGGGGRENMSHLRHCPCGWGEKHWTTFKFLSGNCNEPEKAGAVFFLYVALIDGRKPC